MQASRAGRWTIVGNLDSPNRAAVDPAGLVAIDGRTWSLDWWIGAEDRWHVPAREVAVRQALVDNSPVVETRLRVPSGDAVHRVYAARDLDGAEALVIEVHNDTKVPFALALAIRPYDLDGAGAVAGSSSTAPSCGSTACPRSRCPDRRAASPCRTPPATLLRWCSRATPSRCAAAEVRCADGLANGAFLFPVAHTATVRVALPLGERRRRSRRRCPAPIRSRPGGRRSPAPGLASRSPTAGCGTPSPPAPGSCSSAARTPPWPPPWTCSGSPRRPPGACRPTIAVGAGPGAPWPPSRSTGR